MRRSRANLLTKTAGGRRSSRPPAAARVFGQRAPKSPRPSACQDCVSVTGAGHYAFLTPFPHEMKRADFPPSVDPPGFDRPAFHARLEIEVREFLERTLAT